MKLGRYTSTPVKIPDPLRSIGGIFRFAAETRDAIKSLYERKVIIPRTPLKASGGQQICLFANIVENDDPVNNKALVGGLVTIGSKNFNIENYPFATNADGSQDGVWLIEISIGGVSFNTDDDGTVILPGIKDATGTPSWNKIVSTGSNSYTDNTPPTTPTGTGTVILPIGVLAVNGEQANINRTGCGSFNVGQCSGNFVISRI